MTQSLPRKVAAMVIASFLVLPFQASAADSVVYAVDTTVTIGAIDLIILAGSIADTVTVGATTLTVTPGSSGNFIIASNNKYQLSASPSIGISCSDTQSKLVLIGSTQYIVTPTATAVCAAGGGGGGGGGGSSSTPAAVTPPTPEKLKETPKTEEKAPAKTKEVTAKALTKKLTLTDSKSKASLVLQKGTQLTVGDAAYAGSVSSPGQLNPSKAITDFGSPSATGTVVQAVQSKTTGDVVVWLSKAGTLTFKMTPAQKGTKYKGKDRYALEAYYYNPTSKSFTKMTGKRTGANFAVSDVTYIGGPFFLVQTDMKPAPKAKKTK